jgi:hypothetical protein
MLPMLTDFSRDFCITVAWKIYQKTAASDTEKVDMLRAARSFTDKSEPSAIGQGIDRAGFASV